MDANYYYALYFKDYIVLNTAKRTESTKTCDIVGKKCNAKYSTII